MQWVHVDDLAVAATLAALRPGLQLETCNVAGGELFDLDTLARAVAAVVGPGGPLATARLHLAALPGLPRRYDLERAAQVLGWVPQVRLARGIAAMVSDELTPAPRTHALA
jgi:nucleoside-diphosphate-sugar epimerase